MALSDVPEVRYAKSGSVHIAYQVFGSGTVNLVLTPGFVSNLAYYWRDPGWKQWLEGLGRFARTALFDKRGTGLSDRDAGIPTYEERIDDIRAVMNAAGFDNAVLVGFSDGVAMSILFAARYPSRTKCLVLYGGEVKGSWAPDLSWVATDEQFAESLERLERTYGTKEMAERWVSLVAPNRLGDRDFTGWMGEMLRMACSPGAAVSFAKSAYNMDVRQALPAVCVPTLVVHPTDDRMVDVRNGRYIAERIPGARLLELPTRDHWFFYDAELSDTVLREIEKFATGKESSARAEKPLIQEHREGEFEFETVRGRVIFDQLVNDFLRDYMLLNFMESKSGWRSAVEIARETGIPLSSLYSRRGGLASSFRELTRRGIIEIRLSPGERGRGGEVTKLRVAYEKAPVKEYVNSLARTVVKRAEGETGLKN